MYHGKKPFGKKFRPQKAALLLMAILAFVFVMGAIVMLLWNAILPSVLGVKRLTYWQGVGLFMLAKILLGGWPGRGMKHRYREKKRRWKDKWMNMSEEERARFKDKWKERCQKRK